MASAPVSSPVPSLPHKLAKIYQSGDGQSAKSAFKVSSVAEEYELLGALGLRVTTQSLIMLAKPYDKMTVRDIQTGETRDVWFDISKFFGRF